MFLKFYFINLHNKRLSVHLITIENNERVVRYKLVDGVLDHNMPHHYY